jgi:MoaA/NifB/PqqE/SkfB family radical SAM enzyme
MIGVELYNHLEKIHNIVCFVDLATITKSPSAVFKLFRDYYKEAYAPDERLILYSGEEPSNKLLEHIQKAALTVDISNDFILICCPYNIANTLADVGKKYGSDTPIQNSIIDINSDLVLVDNFYIADTVCPEPWSHLEISNNGSIRPCCIQTDIVGSIQKDQLIDVFHSATMSNLRNNMLNGVRVSGCNNCWATEKAGQLSNRQRRLTLTAKEFYTDWIDNPTISSLDIKPGNVCNFKCRICSPASSSLYASEALYYAADPNKIIQIKNNISTGKWADTDVFLSELESLLPQLTNLDLYGGEPFLLKQLPVMLQKAIDLGVAKNIRLHFNSNGSVFPEKLISLFEQFKEIDIALSIDNTGKRFELERGSTWEQIEKNVVNFVSLQKHNIRVYLFPTINIQNVLYFEDLLDWADQIGIELTYNLLHNPRYLNINNMTNLAKQLVVDRFSNSKHSILQTIANQVRNSKGSDGSEFVAHMREYDRRRSEDLLLTHKEIAHAMGYVL